MAHDWICEMPAVVVGALTTVEGAVEESDPVTPTGLVIEPMEESDPPVMLALIAPTSCVCCELELASGQIGATIPTSSTDPSQHISSEVATPMALASVIVTMSCSPPSAWMGP